MEELWRNRYSDVDDDDDIFYEDIPLGIWLKKEQSRTEFSTRDVGRLSQVVDHAGRSPMKYVTREVVMTDFDCITRTLHLDILGGSCWGTHGSKHAFSCTPWCRDDVSIIAVWPGYALGVTIFYETVAHVILFNLRESSVEEVASWSLGQFWGHQALAMGRVTVQPDFSAMVSPCHSYAMVTGPPSNSDSKVPVTKVLHLARKCFIEDIVVPEFTWIAAAEFHPSGTSKHHHAALICCTKSKALDSFSRPNVTGTLLNFDVNTGKVCSDKRRKGVSSEILKFNRNGDLLFIRFNNNWCIAILDAETFRCYQTIAHDVSQFPPNHCSFRTMYKLFPFVSLDDSKVATLQWVNNREIMRTTRVQPYRTRSLKRLCRQAIYRKSLLQEQQIEQLPLPVELKQYMLWM